MKKNKRVKIPNKLKQLGFRKSYQGKDGLLLFELNPSKLYKYTKKS